MPALKHLAKSFRNDAAIELADWALERPDLLEGEARLEVLRLARRSGNRRWESNLRPSEAHTQSGPLIHRHLRRRVVSGVSSVAGVARRALQGALRGVNRFGRRLGSLLRRDRENLRRYLDPREVAAASLYPNRCGHCGIENGVKRGDPVEEGTASVSLPLLRGTRKR